MRTMIFIQGEQEGSFNLNEEQIISLGLVLRGYANHEATGNDDKIEAILATDEKVILQTTNGIEILNTLSGSSSGHALYSSINTESGEIKTFTTYIEAYDWQFYEERDGVSAKIDKAIEVLTEIKNELNK
jgi:hypothetical protein